MIQTEMLSPVQYDFTIHFLIILPLLTHTHTPNGQQNSCATCMYKLAYLSTQGGTAFSPTYQGKNSKQTFSCQSN